MPNLLLCCSASVATIKVPELVVKLSHNFNVRVVCTPRALYFIELCKTYDSSNWAQFLEIGGNSLITTDDHEWKEYRAIGDPVMHIELAKWADILLIAPASADLCAKISTGICDNLVLCIVRAWRMDKPVVICPAMNTKMWEHPATSTSLDVLIKWGFRLVDPSSKKLACGDVGVGALAPVNQIVARVSDCTKYIPIRSGLDEPSEAAINLLSKLARESFMLWPKSYADKPCNGNNDTDRSDQWRIYASGVLAGICVGFLFTHAFSK